MHIETPVQLTVYGDLADANDQTFAQFGHYNQACMVEVCKRVNLFNLLVTLLHESQVDIGGDWRERRDTLLTLALAP